MAFLVFSVPELNVLLPVGLIFQKISGESASKAYCPENSYRELKLFLVFGNSVLKFFLSSKGSKIKFLCNVGSKVCKGFYPPTRKK